VRTDSGHAKGEEVDDAVPKPRRLHRAVLVLVPLALLVLLSPLVLRRLDYFRVRRVEVVGARFVQPSALLDVLALDSTKTIWERLGPLEERVKHHPQVRDARLSRRLPGTLVLRIVENLPVALMVTRGALAPLDRDGRSLPIDPSRTSLDLPIIAKKDTVALHLLDGIRAYDPALFARVSEARWDERGGLRVLVSGMTVLVAADCTPARFAEIIPVEKDLVRRGHRATELDLRFRDQIVARIE
jgi:cell division protein FtsQ